MAIAFDAVTFATPAAGTTPTYSHTCSGNNRILFVSIVVYGGDTDRINSVTYGGVAMTELIQVQGNLGGTIHHLYYLVAPASGANNVIINASTSISVDTHAASYTGVRQTSPVPTFDGFNTIGGSASIITLDLTTTEANCWLVGGGWENLGSTITGGTGTTVRHAGSSTAWGDSGGVVPIGAQTLNFNMGGVEDQSTGVGAVIRAVSTPEVTTEAVTEVGVNTAKGNGTVVTDNGVTIIERGFVYATTPAPTTANSKTVVAGTTGVMEGTLSGLTAGTLYYVRAFASNASETAYGAEVSFTTTALAARTVYKDMGAEDLEEYAVRLTVGGTVGSVTVKLGSTGDSTVIAAGTGVSTFSGTYGGLNGLTIVASADFNGYIDDVMWVQLVGEASMAAINWALNLFTAVLAISSSVLFRRVEDDEFNRFRIYRYLDLSFKDLDGYVTALIREEKSDAVTTKSTVFLVGGTSGDVSPFVKKKLSFLSKNQAILIGLSNANVNDTFTITKYQLSGMEQSKRMFKPSQIISVS